MPKKQDKEFSVFKVEDSEVSKEASTDVSDKTPDTKEPKAPVKKSVTARSKSKVVKKLTFDRYAKAKGIRTTHVPGMRARVRNPNAPKTMEDWDSFFKDY